jgi:hypothetical protein
MRQHVSLIGDIATDLPPDAESALRAPQMGHTVESFERPVLIAQPGEHEGLMKRKLLLLLRLRDFFSFLALAGPSIGGPRAHPRRLNLRHPRSAAR